MGVHFHSPSFFLDIHTCFSTNRSTQKALQRGYTMLASYTMILFAIYVLLLANTHYRFFSPSLITNTNHDNEALKLPKFRNNTLRLRCYLIWRRWWHYETRILDITYKLGDYLTVLGLVGLHVVLALWQPLYDPDDDMNDPFPKHRRISNRLAQLAIVDLALAVGLSVHTSALWRVIGLQNSSISLPWHRWFARLGTFGVVYHGCFQWSKHYYRHHVAKQQQAMAVSIPFLAITTTRIDYDLADRHGGVDAAWLASVTWWDLLVSSPYYYTGTLMALSVIVLCVGSHPLVREKWYGWFRLTHGVGFLGLVVFGLWHHWTIILFFIAASGLWLLDMVNRWWSTQSVSLVCLAPVSENVVKLQVKVKDASMCDDTRLLPGQFIFCSFSGSKWKDIWWSHPFSISHVDATEKAESIESSESQVLTFYIKANGKQTRRLYNAANTENDWPVVRMGAPLGYSRVTSHWTDIYGLYPVVVLVAEGIGITPWMAVLQSLTSEFIDYGLGDDEDDNDGYEKSRSTNHVHLIWTVREATMIEPLASQIESMIENDSGNKSGTKLRFDWHIYVTGFGPSSHQQQQQQQCNDDEENQTLQNYVDPSSFLLRQQYHQGRPDYDSLLESIRLQHEDDDVALGLCAHEDSVQRCGNLARSSRFNQGKPFWNVKSERFDL
ncbi:unnamed protein product [Absidia cylindrospora]